MNTARRRSRSRAASLRRTALGVAALALLPAATVQAQPSGPKGNLSVAPKVLEHRLRNDRFEIAAVKDTSGRGIISRTLMDVRRLTLRFPKDHFTTEVKWKPAAHGGEGWDNSPPHEIAAYAVQQLFLDPVDYVVPPTSGRCIDFGTYQPISAHAEPTFPHTQCVFGVLSAWLQNVKIPDDALERSRFSHDPRYAYHFGNVNILAVLIAHRDASRTNFVISTDAKNPHLFSVDNGIAFSAELYNFFGEQFDHVVVGGLPKRTIDRLRKLTPASFDRFGVIEEYGIDSVGILRPRPVSGNADPKASTRVLPDGVQIGLTQDEIDAMKKRWQQLLERVDRGEIPTF